MNANLVMAYVDSIPTMVKGDKDYIRMLIEQAVKRMPPPLTEEEEQAAKADAEARVKLAEDAAREKEAREAEIAVKEAEQDRVAAEAMAKAAADNETAVKSAAGTTSKPKKNATHAAA